MRRSTALRSGGLGSEYTVNILGEHLHIPHTLPATNTALALREEVRLDGKDKASKNPDETGLALELFVRGRTRWIHTLGSGA